MGLEKKTHQRPRSSSESGADRGKETFEDIYTELGEGRAREQSSGPASDTSGRALTSRGLEGTETGAPQWQTGDFFDICCNNQCDLA